MITDCLLNCHGNPETMQKHQNLGVYVVGDCVIAAYITWNHQIHNSCPNIQLATIIGECAAAKQPISELQWILSHSALYGKEER